MMVLQVYTHIQMYQIVYIEFIFLCMDFFVYQ